MTQKTEKIQVQIKYKGVEQQFCAEPQDVWLLLNQFFKDLIPSFEVAQKLCLNIDIQQLARDLEGLVAFSGEGAVMLAPKNKLTDNEALMLWLTAQYLGQNLTLVSEDWLTKDSLQVKLGKTGKIVSTRLGELVKNDVVLKSGDDQFKITTYGLMLAQKEVIPKIKQKLKT